jgi:gliding motility-associated-like protein
MFDLKGVTITILFLKFGFCFAQSILFDFSTWPTGSTDITNTQGSCSMRTQVVGSGFVNSAPRYDDAGVSWSPTNGTGLSLDHNWSNTSTNTTVTLTFNPAILNPTFSIYDINRNGPCAGFCSSAWTDRVTVSTTDGVITATSAGPPEHTITTNGSNSVAIEANMVCNGINAAVAISIIGNVSTITLRYDSGSSVTRNNGGSGSCGGDPSGCFNNQSSCPDPGRQYVTIGGVSGNTCCLSTPTVPTFNPISPICNGAALSPLPTTSNNGVTGTWSPALNNTATTTYTFTPSAGQCATTTTLIVAVNPVVVPAFTQVNPICSGASLSSLPTTSNNGITGTWSPGMNNTATTTYTFTPSAGQCATTASMTITVNQPIVPTFTPVGTICTGAPISPLPTTSNNNINGSWSPVLNNTATTTYTFTPAAGQCASSTTMTITVGSPVAPTFDAINPICSGAVLSPLPTASTNGIVGVWSPALNNTATTDYIFTPNSGQCATTVTLTITVNPVVVPVFTQVPAICTGTALSPLPTTSNNGISGTWSPSMNNTATTTYTFIPNGGQCATTASMTITVNQLIAPTFTPVGPICTGASISPLPTTSNNNINGSWSPALNNSATTTYTFTPTAGQCANSTTMTITVGSPVTATFNAIQPICEGTSVNPLSLTSIEGISGSWSPAFNNMATTTYTFTPNSGQCASNGTLSVVVNASVVPQFQQVAPVCSGEMLSPLPITSDNGIVGAWSPVLNNTATTTYTFAPESGQCATLVDMTITVNSPSAVPLFPLVSDLCLGSVPPVLNSVSDNGISGTWSSQISTAVSGTQTYTFAPDPGVCGVSTSINVTVTDPLDPVFNPLQDICQNDLAPALSNTSNNGISGVWSSQINSAVIGLQTINFTPDNGQCALPTSVSLTVNTLPVVNAGNDAVLCEGEQITINATGANAYTWSNGLSNGLTMAPAVGANTYSVTGTDLNGCSSSDQITILVHPLPLVNAGSDQTICQGASITLTGSGALSYTWDNGVVNGQQFIQSSGILVYTVEGVDQNGCIGTDQVNINVIPTPVPNFQVIGSGCVPLSITLQNSTPNATSCEWMISNGDVLSGCNTVTTELLQGGCYDVTLTTEVNGCTASFTAFDIVCAEAAPDADFSFSPGTVSTLDPVVQFQNLSSGATNYTWNFGDNSALSNETNPSHVYPDDVSSNYEIMLVAYSQSGCTDTAYAYITVEEELIFYVPNTFTPDGDVYNQTFQPVFTSGFDPYDYHLAIFNRWGQIVFESYNHLVGWDGTYGGVNGGDLYNCQDGTYTWKIEYKIMNNDARKVAIGHVNILR